MEGLPGFILAALALCGSPGPATVSQAATGAAFGPRRSLAYMAGIDAGMVVVMSVTAAGVTGLVLAIPGATPVVAVLAALYFVHLVRMQHEHLSGRAALRGAAIAEGLHAFEREADRIGVVPVRVEAVSGKMRLDALHAG